MVDGLWAQILFFEMTAEPSEIEFFYRANFSLFEVRDEAPTYGVQFSLPFLSRHKELRNYKVPKRLSVLPFLTSCGI